MPGAHPQISTITLFVGFGALLFTAQYLQLVLGLSPLRAGLWSLPSSAGFVIGSMVTPLLARRAPAAVVMAAGLTLAAVGFGLLTQLQGTTGLAILVARSVIFSLGLAPVDTLATDLAVGAAPPERAGAASAITETSAAAALAFAILVGRPAPARGAPEPTARQAIWRHARPPALTGRVPRRRAERAQRSWPD